MPSIDALWIYIKDHWQDHGETELWVSKTLTKKAAIKSFLVSNKPDTLDNGFLDIVVHSTCGSTNLTYDEHKNIRITTKDENIFNKFGHQIIDSGFKQTRNLHSLDNGFYHWHYRPFNSMDRTGFKDFLTRNNFELLDKWPEN